MDSVDHPHWPPHLPYQLTAPEVTLCEHLAVSAQRYPDKAAFIFYGTALSYASMHRQVEALAGYLQERSGLRQGDRVVLDMQSCPQFVVGYYAILRAGGVVVPVNPMYRKDELRHLLEDTGARIALCALEKVSDFSELRDLCPQIVAADYRDALTEPTDVPLPAVLESAGTATAADVVHWKDALDAAIAPSPLVTQPQDLCMLLYSSGTTGRPKGCMHSHWALGRIAAGVLPWMNICTDTVLLLSTPLFHIAGMLNMMIAPVLAGASVVICSRWDRDVACQLTDRYRISHWTMLPTMIIDLLNNPRLGEYSLRSVRRIGGGGASMPEAVAQKLEARWGVRYMEGYGLSETGHVLSNPPQHPKRQCLGIPLYGVDARIVEVQGTQEVDQGDEGEILISGPSMFLGYWNNEAATRETFVDIDGKRFLRTGDIGRIDEEGYFFIVDRLKRMVNASGFKVWPAEIEAMLHAHPAVLEACVISAPDAHRGETVKAVIALRKEFAGSVHEDDIVAWSKERMAAFKYPRIVEFVDALPKTASGKVDWRSLQQR